MRLIGALAIVMALLSAPAAADTVNVVQVGNSFQPKDVTICIGDTVQWIWSGGVHTVTAGNDGTVDGDEAFHGDLDAADPTFSVTFDDALVAAGGTFYDYFCAVHFALGMGGTITVLDCPEVYCTGKPSSAFCLTAIGTSDPVLEPVSGAGGYLVTADYVQSFKNGLLFVGVTGPAVLPFGGGTLCVSPPLERGPMMNALGTGPNLCDGSFANEVNDGSIAPMGLDVGSGNTGWYQYWYRDPGNGAGNLGTALSNAVELDFQ